MRKSANSAFLPHSSRQNVTEMRNLPISNCILSTLQDRACHAHFSNVIICFGWMWLYLLEFFMLIPVSCNASCVESGIYSGNSNPLAIIFH